MNLLHTVSVVVLSQALATACQAQYAPNPENLQLRYVASYPDLITAYNSGQDANWPAYHFATVGWAEGRSLRFDAWLYLFAHNDLATASAGLSDAARETWAANHYRLHGFYEGRVFDSAQIRANVAAYSAGYADICHYGLTSAARHFVVVGQAAGRTTRPAVPCPGFSLAAFPTYDEVLLRSVPSPQDPAGATFFFSYLRQYNSDVRFSELRFPTFLPSPVQHLNTSTPRAMANQ